MNFGVADTAQKNIRPGWQFSATPRFGNATPSCVGASRAEAPHDVANSHHGKLCLTVRANGSVNSTNPDSGPVVALYPGSIEPHRSFFRNAMAKPCSVTGVLNHNELAKRIDQNFSSLNPSVDLESANHSEWLGPISPDELPSSLLDEYCLKRVIGYGGMGTVYEAQDSLRSRVALKIVRVNERACNSQRFEQEAKISASLHHPNIVPVYDFGSFQNLKFMSMRFIDGPSLSEVLDVGDVAQVADPQANRISAALVRNPKQIADIGVQAAEALDFAHQHGVLHRDIKPGNLLVDDRLRTWVADFGLAKIRGLDSSLTKDDLTVGTLRYMSPEQLMGCADERSDVYSLGLTLCELAKHATGRDILSNSRASRRRRSSDNPSGLEAVLLKACHVEPELRYQSAREFAVALSRFAESRKTRQPVAEQISQLSRVFAISLIMGFLCWYVMSTMAHHVISPAYAAGNLLSNNRQIIRNLGSNLGDDASDRISDASKIPTLDNSGLTLFDLQIGDVLRCQGLEWNVEGQCVYAKENATWQEYELRNGTREAWLSVEQTQSLKVSIWYPIELPNLTREPPLEIKFDGSVFHRTETGGAQMMYLTAATRPAFYFCRYYDYQGPGTKLLSVEDWHNDIKAYIGNALELTDVEVVSK